jgi:hypothetical protein
MNEHVSCAARGPGDDAAHTDETVVAQRIVAHLNAAAHDLDPVLAARLRAARARAVAAHRPRRGPARWWSAVAGAWSLRPLLRQAVAVAAVLALVAVGDYWNTWARLLEMEETDTALLADELPIDAYLDTEFNAWLRQDSAS